jgi:cardiolipin synthase
MSNVIGAAFTNRRLLEPIEARIMIVTGALLLTAALLFAFFPRLLVYPIVATLVWIAVALLYRGYRLYGTLDRKRKKGE